MDVHTLSTAASPNALSPGVPGAPGPLGLVAPPSPVSHARAAAAALSSVAEARDSGCEDEDEEEREIKSEEPMPKTEETVRHSILFQLITQPMIIIFSS